jgi:hypothetical protein
MDKLLDTFDQAKFNQEAINHLDRYTTSNEIEAAIKSPLKKISLGHNRFTAQFYQTFKELIPKLLKLFHEIERVGT